MKTRWSFHILQSLLLSSQMLSWTESAQLHGFSLVFPFVSFFCYYYYFDHVNSEIVKCIEDHVLRIGSYSFLYCNCNSVVKEHEINIIICLVSWVINCLFSFNVFCSGCWSRSREVAVEVEANTIACYPSRKVKGKRRWCRWWRWNGIVEMIDTANS